MPLERSADRLRRILVLVPYVIANPGSSITELCDRFSVSRDDLSADLELLFMCGLPPFGPGDLIDVAIEGDHVSINMADYLARPPRLTRAEALALLVMGRALLSMPGFEEADSLRRALDKLAVAVAPADAEGAQQAAAHIDVELASAGTEHLADVRRAIEDRARIHIAYWTEGRAEMTERDIDPMIAFSSNGQWYVDAIDYSSGEERRFRIDRIREMKRTGETFESLAGFEAEKYERAALFTPSPRDIEVVIEVSPAAGWVREFVPYEREGPAEDGWTALTVRTPHLAWLVRLLLQAGPNARAVSPKQLIDDVRDAAERALALYDA